MYYKIIDDKTVYSDGKILNTEITKGDSTRKVTIINPTEQQMLDAGWQVWIEPEPSEETKLQMAKQEKIMQIDNYDASPKVEQFTINDTPMWLNHEVRQQIKTSVEAYIATGKETVTKIFDGVEYTFPCETWLQMLAALEVYAAEALNATERHKINVSKMDNIQDVIDYDYTTGYPLKLSFGNNGN